MITETTYYPYELKKGKCTCCGERSNEILINDGRCAQCIEDEKFYNESMKDFERPNNRSPFDFSL